jgi:hypothetical protein
MNEWLEVQFSSRYHHPVRSAGGECGRNPSTRPKLLILKEIPACEHSRAWYNHTEHIVTLPHSTVKIKIQEDPLTHNLHDPLDYVHQFSFSAHSLCFELVAAILLIALCTL